MTTFSEVYDKLAGGTVGNWLAIVGVLSLIYWTWRIVAALQHRKSNDLPVVDAPAVAVEQPAEPAAEDIVVIAAAVHAMLGAHRIVHIEAERTEQTWAIEGRWMQQTSHQTR